MRTLLNLSHSRCYNELSGEREGTTVVRDPRRPVYLFLGLALEVAQPEAALAKASLWSMLGLAFLTLASSDFMKML